MSLLLLLAVVLAVAVVVAVEASECIRLGVGACDCVCVCVCAENSSDSALSCRARVGASSGSAHPIAARSAGEVGVGPARRCLEAEHSQASEEGRRSVARARRGLGRRGEGVRG